MGLLDMFSWFDADKLKPMLKMAVNVSGCIKKIKIAWGWNTLDLQSSKYYWNSL